LFVKINLELNVSFDLVHLFLLKDELASYPNLVHTGCGVASSPSSVTLYWPASNSTFVPVDEPAKLFWDGLLPWISMVKLEGTMGFCSHIAGSAWHATFLITVKVSVSTGGLGGVVWLPFSPPPTVDTILVLVFLLETKQSNIQILSYLQLL
jgi:hypothetical protein